ncbi:unnamed protein product [Ixodes persulcatus]
MECHSDSSSEVEMVANKGPDLPTFTVTDHRVAPENMPRVSHQLESPQSIDRAHRTAPENVPRVSYQLEGRQGIDIGKKMLLPKMRLEFISDWKARIVLTQLTVVVLGLEFIVNQRTRIALIEHKRSMLCTPQLNPSKSFRVLDPNQPNGTSPTQLVTHSRNIRLK